MPLEFIIITVAMLGIFWLLSRGAKKAQKAQIAKREEALVVGNNVVTQSGFFGRIVDIDGDAVTLESPSGDESVWMRNAIAAQMDIPLSHYDESADAGEAVVEAQSDSTPEAGASEEIANSSPFADDEQKPDNK
ncbi:preprotein translocase subunit YajC [Trueperella pyogenes]|uniref:Preprotein translocase subunit YajC n=1 Tax=Trueperella pyogenes TaxID=1661 RepID=A0ABV3NBY0_9ACTO|nr:preprotein translocase subunit YajC [Trueperella pyogenes]AHU88802.1 preprotein translocase subunit YajC [Trueperella pyogenes]OQD39797.1 preprotein translocase subunit YajC [Trueperella pyogenes]OQD40108.1 preprotein translocase subunit YajC [Trueperella pyogenes]UVJ54601.1 preprotein translocase subunit YajC [Trueperella pyogenes]UVJ58622.1 preprotein translocase subunit YajC [Trueperella pyogenes]